MSKFNQEVKGNRNYMAAGRVSIEHEVGRCSICLETPRVPTALPCQHTFCKTCISEYIHSKETETKQNHTDCSCPICRTNLTSERKELFAVFENSAEKEMETETKFDCGPCKEKEKKTSAIKWCRDCQDAFCENCAVDHNSFKCLKNHEILSLEEMRDGKDLRSLVNFSDKCPIHPAQLAEVYCLDHQQLCCISCFMSTHRKCENASLIKELVEKTNDSSSTYVFFKSDLSKIQIATDELLHRKIADKSKVEQTFLDIEESVNSTVQKIKDNLETLMISFRKELHLKQDDFEAKVNPSIKEIKTFKETIAKAVHNLEFVQSYGTPTQLFIYIQRTKNEIKKVLKERVRPVLITTKLEIELVLEDVARQMERLSNLGKVNFLEMSDEACSEFRSQIDGSFCNFIRFDTIKVKQDKIIVTQIDKDVRTGTSVDDTTILVACGIKILVFDIMTKKMVNEYVTKATIPKRLSYEEKSKFLYISYDGGNLHRLVYDKTQGVFSDLLVIKDQQPLNGGVCNDGHSFFTIFGDGLFKNENIHTNIFNTDTNCYMCLNGLAFDKKNERFIYTSRNNEVVAISKQGKEIFRYKDNNMKTVSSVAVLDCGAIIAGDEAGEVHAVSEDGKQRKTLIEKCEKISKVCDVWVDKNSKALFVCGNTYVEIYNIE